jgi:hypothetical protein
VPGWSPPWRGGWHLVERHGPPPALVAAGPVTGGRVARLGHPTSPAVVVGSAQPCGDFDAARCRELGFELVRRHSGGGAVLVVPGAQVWLDLHVPAGDELWRADLIASSAWVGELWRDALRATGNGEGLAVHAGRLVVTPWSGRICFAGLGPGEVARGRRKVTGLAQRRDRSGAWFFTMALVLPEQHRLATLLATGEDAELEAQLRAETGAAGCSATALEEALAAGLGGDWSAGEDVPAEPHPAERDH